MSSNKPDIAERLRERAEDHNPGDPWPRHELQDAADEIERLREELDDLRRAVPQRIAEWFKGVRL